MTGVLGYDGFVAHGGDFGASVSDQIALNNPQGLLAIQLTSLPPQHAQTAEPEGLTETERAFLLETKAWAVEEGAFTAIQSSKHQTVSYGLNDSPAGTLAWIVEKFHGWSDRRPTGRMPFTAEELLNNVMIYWVTQTTGSSAQWLERSPHSTSTARPMG